METFEFATKKAKRKNRLITIGSTLALIFVGLTGARMLSGKMIQDRAWEVVQHTELMDAVAYPNQNLYSWSANGGDIFHGGIKNKWGREIAGVPVSSTIQEIDFNWFSIDWSDILSTSPSTYLAESVYDIENNQKRGLFYNPLAKSTNGEVIAQPVQEIPLLKNGGTQRVEVFVTFDQPYTLKDIRQKIPADLRQNWYWIGTKTTGDTSTWKDYDLYGTDARGFVKEELVDPEAFEKAMKKAPEEREEEDTSVYDTQTVDAFLTNLKAVLDTEGQSLYGNVNPRDDIKAYLEQFGDLDLTKDKELERLTFGGIVLTGEAEDFAQLEHADWIYAASIGAVAPETPYSTLFENKE